MRVVEYIEDNGTSPFEKWFNSLNVEAAAKVTSAVIRMQADNLSNLKSVGAGVHEFRIRFGPGYRIYVGRDGNVLIILLGGGTKQRQASDIAAAKESWRDYKRRKARNR